MPPKKDKKDKKVKKPKKVLKQKQRQSQTQVVNINLSKSKRRSTPKPPVSNVPINIIRMNEPPMQLASQPMYQQPLREPLKDPTAPSILLPTAPVASDVGAGAEAEAGAEVGAGGAKRGRKPLTEEQRAIKNKKAEMKKFEKRLEKQLADEELARQRAREEGSLPQTSMPVMPSSEARKTGGGKK